MSKIKPKRSYTSGAVPTASDLDVNEIAISWADNKLYTKNPSGNIVTVTLGGGGGTDARWELFLPPAPTSVSGSSGNAQVSLSWTAPSVLSQTPITDYVVQYSSNSGSSWTTFSDGTSASTSATVTGLTNGTGYTFRVAAVNGVGQGAWSSASASVTPTAGNIIQTTSGLYAWYDASANNSVYSAQTGGSVVTSDGGLVYRLADLSGNGRHLKTYYDGPYVPSLAASAQNGKNALAFNAGAGTTYLKTAENRESGSFSVSNPLTIFAVWKPLDNESQVIDDLRYSWGDRELSTAVQMGLRGGAVQASAPGQAKWVENNYSRSGNWICARAIFNGSSSTLYVNGAYAAPGGYSEPTQTPADINMTHPCGDWRMNGYFQFGELAFYTGAISSGTCASIESYLMTKWGIS